MRRLRCCLKEFSKRELQAWERLPLPTKYRDGCTVLPGTLSARVGGTQVFHPFAGSPKLSDPRYSVTHSSWCGGDTVLGTESPGHAGRASTVWLRSCFATS